MYFHHHLVFFFALFEQQKKKDTLSRVFIGYALLFPSVPTFIFISWCTWMGFLSLFFALTHDVCVQRLKIKLNECFFHFYYEEAHQPKNPLVMQIGKKEWDETFLFTLWHFFFLKGLYEKRYLLTYLPLIPSLLENTFPQKKRRN